MLPQARFECLYITAQADFSNPKGEKCNLREVLNCTFLIRVELSILNIFKGYLILFRIT